MRHRPDTLMLFAAGFGKRMLPLTENLPKPLIPVAGKALIDHAIGSARAAGVTTIIANVHYLAELIEAYLHGSKVRTIREMPAILETGGGLRNALPLLGTEPVYTMNTDAVWTGPNPLETLAEHWDPTRMDALHLLIPVARAGGHSGKGDWDRTADGRLSRGGDYIYSGVQITKTDRLALIPQASFSLNVIWDAMIADNRLFGVVHAGGWCDVGRPESIPIAEALLKSPHV